MADTGGKVKYKDHQLTLLDDPNAFQSWVSDLIAFAKVHDLDGLILDSPYTTKVAEAVLLKPRRPPAIPTFAAFRAANNYGGILTRKQFQAARADWIIARIEARDAQKSANLDNDDYEKQQVRIKSAKDLLGATIASVFRENVVPEGDYTPRQLFDAIKSYCAATTTQNVATLIAELNALAFKVDKYVTDFNDKLAKIKNDLKTNNSGSLDTLLVQEPLATLRKKYNQSKHIWQYQTHDQALDHVHTVLPEDGTHVRIGAYADAVKSDIGEKPTGLSKRKTDVKEPGVMNEKEGHLYGHCKEIRIMHKPEKCNQDLNSQDHRPDLAGQAHAVGQLSAEISPSCTGEINTTQRNMRYLAMTATDNEGQEKHLADTTGKNIKLEPCNPSVTTTLSNDKSPLFKANFQDSSEVPGSAVHHNTTATTTSPSAPTCATAFIAQHQSHESDADGFTPVTVRRRRTIKDNLAESKERGQTTRRAPSQTAQATDLADDGQFAQNYATISGWSPNKVSRGSSCVKGTESTVKHAESTSVHSCQLRTAIDTSPAPEQSSRGTAVEFMDVGKETENNTPPAGLDTLRSETCMAVSSEIHTLAIQPGARHVSTAILDSGASHCIFDDKSLFQDLVGTDYYMDTAGKCHGLHVLGRGKVVLYVKNRQGAASELAISNCQYAPDARFNIMSMSKLGKGFTGKWDGNGISIHDLSEVEVTFAKMSNGLYHLDIFQSPDVIAAMAVDRVYGSNTIDDSQTLHLISDQVKHGEIKQRSRVSDEDNHPTDVSSDAVKLSPEDVESVDEVITDAYEVDTHGMVAMAGKQLVWTDQRLGIVVELWNANPNIKMPAFVKLLNAHPEFAQFTLTAAMANGALTKARKKGMDVPKRKEFGPRAVANFWTREKYEEMVNIYNTRRDLTLDELAAYLNTLPGWAGNSMTRGKLDQALIKAKAMQFELKERLPRTAVKNLQWTDDALNAIAELARALPKLKIDRLWHHVQEHPYFADLPDGEGGRVTDGQLRYALQLLKAKGISVPQNTHKTPVRNTSTTIGTILTLLTMDLSNAEYRLSLVHAARSLDMQIGVRMLNKRLWERYAEEIDEKETIKAWPELADDDFMINIRNTVIKAVAEAKRELKVCRRCNYYGHGGNRSTCKGRPCTNCVTAGSRTCNFKTDADTTKRYATSEETTPKTWLDATTETCSECAKHGRTDCNGFCPCNHCEANPTHDGCTVKMDDGGYIQWRGKPVLRRDPEASEDASDTPWPATYDPKLVDEEVADPMAEDELIDLDDYDLADDGVEPVRRFTVDEDPESDFDPNINVVTFGPARLS